MLAYLVKKFFFYDVLECKLNLFCRTYKNLYGLKIFLHYISTISFALISFTGFCYSVIIKEHIVIANTFMVIGLILLCMQTLECDTVKHPSTKITDFLYRLTVSFLISGKGLNSKDWIKIEEKDKKLYSLLLNPNIFVSSFNISLKIARIVPECKLVWALLTDPEDPKGGYHPYSYVMKDNYVYDPILHQNIPRKDYEDLFNIYIYAIWDKEYLDPDFGLKYFEDFKNFVLK